ncbi:hypothetical protein D3C87_1139680 [compost metagenome]
MMNEIAVRTLPAANRVIRSIELKEVSINSEETSWRSPDQRQAVVIVLESGWSVVLVDACGQCCCEERYMSTPDDLESLVGETLMGIRHGGTSEKEGDWGVVEAEFVHIQTDRDSICIGTYNEHNGYYGGLNLAVTILDPEGNAVVYQKSFTEED